QQPVPLSTYPKIFNPGQHRTQSGSWSISSPVDWLLVSVVDGPVELTSFPLPRSTYASPAPTIAVQSPLNIGVNGPLELCPFVDGAGLPGSGDPAIWIPAQFQQFGDPVTLHNYSVSVIDANNSLAYWEHGLVLPPAPLLASDAAIASAG